MGNVGTFFLYIFGNFLQIFFMSEKKSEWEDSFNVQDVKNIFSTTDTLLQTYSNGSQLEEFDFGQARKFLALHPSSIFFFNLPIPLFFYLPTHQPIYLFIYLFFRLYIPLFIRLIIHQFIHLPVYLFTIYY